MNNVVGIDVSKGKSMVSVLRPFGEVVAKPFSIGHTGSELKELAESKCDCSLQPSVVAGTKGD